MSSSKTGQMARAIARRAAAATTPTCGSGSPGNSDLYNTPLHVAALFVILFVSFSACAFPLIVIRYPRLRIPSGFLFSARHFGTGVLIATAFVHLLPTAFISLTDPCLSGFWTDNYPAMAGAISLGAVLLVTVIEMVFSPGHHSHMAPVVQREALTGGDISIPNSPSYSVENSAAVDPTSPLGPMSPRSLGPISPRSPVNGIGEDKVRRLGPLGGRTTSVGRELQRMSAIGERMDNLASSDTLTTAVNSEKGMSALPKCADDVGGVEKIDIQPLTEEQKHKKALLQCMLLEMGILFHSVFIGMALSVSIGGDFVMLWIAITFHQTFEGLALGSRIASLNWRSKAIQPWMMALAYGCTTPLGQAIGLATHTLYDPDSETGLLLVGVMNAISSGLLIFASLVELMAEDFLSDDSWRILRGRRRVAACCLVFTGAAGMSLIGAWA